MSRRPMPGYVSFILNTLEKNGHRTYAVGGCVRDTILGRRPNDWDVATDASCRRVAELFGRTIPTGEKYGTVTVFVSGGSCEVTTFRRDDCYSDGRHPENVSFVGSIEEDLSRRDFTINAMAMDISGRITDPIGGRADIEGKIIRCVGDPDKRFSEDALRMFRAVRFSAQLGFEIEEKTMKAIFDNATLAESVSAERICAETEKILLSKRPEMLETAIKAGLYAGFISAGNIGIKSAKRIPAKPHYRWAYLVGALLSAGAIEDGTEFLRKMRLDRTTVRLAGTAWGDLPETHRGITEFAVDNGTEALLCAAAQNEGAGAKNAFARIYYGAWNSDFTDVASLRICGDDLINMGITGRDVGATLKRLAVAVNCGETENNRDALIKTVKDGLK